MTITFSIDKQKIIRTDSNVVVENSINYLDAEFTFSEDWTHEKVAIFGHNGVYYHVVLVDDKCVVPVEVLKHGTMKVGVYSSYEDTGIVRICTDRVEISVLESITFDSSTPSDPTLDIYEQLLDQYDNVMSENDTITSRIDNLTTDEVAPTEGRYYITGSMPISNKDLKFLNANLEFEEISLGSSGYTANLIANMIDSDVSGYKTLSYSNVAQAEQTNTVSATDGDKLIYQAIFGTEIHTDRIDAGTWTANFYAKCSPNTGITRFKIQIFVYHADTTMETLCEEYTSELDITSYGPLICRVVKDHFDVLETDRLGVRIYVTTTASNTITVNHYIGGSFPLFFTTPLALRHNQLRGLNEDTAYQHINAVDRSILDKFSIDVNSKLNVQEIHFDGLVRFDDTCYEDLCFPLTQGKPTSGGKPDYDYTNLGFLFPGNDTTEQIHIIQQLPHAWKEGTRIFPHVHWRQSQSGNYVFKMQYKWYNVGDLVPTNWSTYVMDQKAFTYSSDTLDQLNYGLGIDGTGKKISSTLLIKLYREDLISGDALTDMFDIHIEKDSIGSETEMTKGE